MNKFKIGDRVMLAADNTIHGVVTKVYSKGKRVYNNIVLGPYPELYAVKWNGLSTESLDYSPHGLDHEAD